MSESVSHEALIARLSAELRPVRRLLAPWKRSFFWLLAVLMVGLPFAYGANWAALASRLGAAPDMWLSQLGAMLTALFAAFAALQTSIPGRSWRWTLLPLPACLLWVGASTAGCLRPWPIPDTIAEPHMHAMACLKFILLMSLPLASLLTWLLLRACPLRPGLTAMLGGLASAAAAASLLTLVHPFDATAGDLAMHLLAVLCVVGLSRLGALALRR